MAIYEIYYDAGSWHLDYDGDTVADSDTPIEAAQDFIAFLGLDAAIGTGTDTPVVDED